MCRLSKIEKSAKSLRPNVRSLQKKVEERQSYRYEYIPTFLNKEFLGLI